MWYTYVVEANFPESLAMPSYLQKRRRRWYAILEIPMALRPHFGNKPRFVQSLETESRTVAERRVLQVVAAWKKEIATARNEPDDIVAWRPNFVVRGRSFPQPPISANAMRRALQNAKTEEQRQRILEEIDDAAHWIGAVNVENVGEAPSSDPEAQRFYASATGALVPFSEHLDEWLTTSRRHG